MLKKIDAQTVVSDEGFSIKPAGLEIIEYKFNSKTVLLDVTCNRSTRKVQVYVTDVLYWNTPHEEKITDDEKSAMKENISKAMALLDDDFEII